MSDTQAIYQAMIDVMRDVTHLGKDQRNPSQGFKFRGIDDLLNVLGPAMRKHGVFVLPNVQEIDSERIQTKAGGGAYRTIVKVAYTFIAADGSSVPAVGRGESIDTGDKSVSKAMTMAFKTMLFQLLALPTDELTDPDAEVHQVEAAPDPEAEARKQGIDEVRNALLAYANQNEISPQKLSVQFAEQYDKPISQGTLEELQAFNAKLQLGGEEVPDGANA